MTFAPGRARQIRSALQVHSKKKFFTSHTSILAGLENVSEFLQEVRLHQRRPASLFLPFQPFGRGFLLLLLLAQKPSCRSRRVTTGSPAPHSCHTSPQPPGSVTRESVKRSQAAPRHRQQVARNSRSVRIPSGLENNIFAGRSLENS